MRRTIYLLPLALASLACSNSPKQCPGGCACQAQSDCPSGQSCVAGFCAVNQACVSDQDCSNPSDVCVSGSCVPGGLDAGPDAGKPDAGGRDAGPDAGHVDGGFDAGTFDGGLDAGDAGGAPDSGPDGGFDAGPTPDSGPPDAGCAQASDCSTGVCKAGGCTSCTANTDCISPMVCCLSGSCPPGTCIPPGCTSDTQCNPPDEICVVGKCVTGCLPGGCDAGLRCESAVSGRCQPASGNGAPGQACQTFSDCGATPANGNSGDCLSFVPPDGGVQSFCSFACQGTAQCPGGFACAIVGAGGQCVPESFLPEAFGVGAIGGGCSAGSRACDSVLACGIYGASPGAVCSDTCLGPASEVCPTIGWQCNDVLDFDAVVGAGTGCSADSTCTSLSPDARCYTTALGGDNLCHLVSRQEICGEAPSGGAGTTGSACSADAQCKFGFCNAGKCADPCCTSADCASGFACAPVIAPQYSVVMACVPSTQSSGVGTACDPTAANSCRALLPAQGGGGGLCIRTSPYDLASTTGYCSDYCCNDDECGPGYTCGLYEIGTDGKGKPLYANACLML